MNKRIALALTILILLPAAWLMTAGAQEAAPAQTATAPAAETPAPTAEEPLTPEKEQDIRKLMDITGASRMGNIIVEQMLTQFRSAYPAMAGEFFDELRKEFSVDDLIDVIVPIYAKHLTHEDIKGLIAFYESPLGQRFTAAQPALVRDSMEAGQGWGQQMAMTIFQRMEQRRQSETQPAEEEGAAASEAPEAAPAQ